MLTKLNKKNTNSYHENPIKEFKNPSLTIDTTTPNMDIIPKPKYPSTDVLNNLYKYLLDTKSNIKGDGLDKTAITEHYSNYKYVLKQLKMRVYYHQITTQLVKKL